jgi:hypothetical protein
MDATGDWRHGGLAARLEDAGRTLSSGERSSIRVARALASDPRSPARGPENEYPPAMIVPRLAWIIREV